jgi:hypothetical protein
MVPASWSNRVVAVRRALILLAATVTVTGCNASLKQEDLRGKTVRPKTQEQSSASDEALAGRVYVKAGDKDLDADLYEMRFSPFRLDQLTKGSRVTTVGGCSTRVVVAAAQREVGYADRLQELRDGKLVPIDKLGLEVGSDPDVADDCRILYVRLAGGGPSSAEEIKLWDPTKAASTTVASGPTVVGASWGPHGEIVILKRDPAGPRLLIQRSDGAKTELDPGVPDVGNTPWGKSGWMALAVFADPKKPPTATLFLNPSSDRGRSQLEGWLPLAWSPDGNRLLVRDSGAGTALGLVEMPDRTRVREIGRSTVGTVWDAVWLPQS